MAFHLSSSNCIYNQHISVYFCIFTSRNNGQPSGPRKIEPQRIYPKAKGSKCPTMEGHQIKPFPSRPFSPSPSAYLRFRTIFHYTLAGASEKSRAQEESFSTPGVYKIAVQSDTLLNYILATLRTHGYRARTAAVQRDIEREREAESIFRGQSASRERTNEEGKRVIADRESLSRLLVVVVVASSMVHSGVCPRIRKEDRESASRKPELQGAAAEARLFPRRLFARFPAPNEGLRVRR